MNQYICGLALGTILGVIGLRMYQLLVKHAALKAEHRKYLATCLSETT